MSGALQRRAGRWVGLSLALIAVNAIVPGAHAGDTQQHFATVGQAMDTLLAAANAGDGDTLARVFGPDSEEILSSGDPVADEAARAQFVEAAGARICFESPEPDRIVFSIGVDDWPFPIPLVKDDSGWRFDAAAGKEEILNRRIGRNELNAIAVARAYVDAQEEYAASDPTGEGVRQYAQRILSSPGGKDGLYWSAEEDEPESPFGPLIAAAVDQGYQPGESARAEPYYGYYFRPLTAQGASAPGGAKNYIEDGRMTKGFALIAYPAEYGNSGIMTFLVNNRDIVFQKDLGDDTRTIASEITEYAPDKTWEPVTEPES
jgi:hypothetical protein